MAPSSEGLDRFQYLRDMARNLDLAPGAAHDAVPVNQKRAAVNAHVLAAVHAFLDPDPVMFGDLAGSVGGENERQRVLLLELVMRSDGIARHADDDGPGLAEIRERVTEAAG